MRLYGLADMIAAEEMGVLKLRRRPYPELSGKGVVLGIADTGIDYTHPVFRRRDGSSRILAIWDQTAAGNDGTVPFGKLYFKEQIDEALQSDYPLDAVPVTDEIGHGTFLAGLAAGNVIEEEEFTGIAPEADILVVKLREADEDARKTLFVSGEVPAYTEADLISATDFLISYVVENDLPMVLCYGIASSQGIHEGNGVFSGYLNLISQQEGRAVVVAGGNEGNTAHHFSSRSYEGVIYQDVELRIKDIKDGIWIEFWADAPDLYGIGFVSPAGEVIEKLPNRVSLKETISFVFEETVIYVDYERVEAATGATFIQIRMQQPTDGIWKIRIFQEEVYGGRFDLWLPVAPLIQGEAVFLKPDPKTTITEPGNSIHVMTIGAYDTTTEGIFLESSRGFSRNGNIKPDFAAPGVSVLGPIRGGLYTRRSGTSVAAALSAGIALLMMEYDPEFTGVQMKSYLVRGAKRDGEDYPNTEFGWGKIDIYETLLDMRESNRL